jgi:hypothetical protein
MSSAAGLQSTLSKVNRFFAFGAGMGAIELIGEDFNLFIAFRAPAGKRAEIFVGLESGAVLRGSLFRTHGKPPLLNSSQACVQFIP